MIRHTVVFRLCYPKDSPQERVFFQAAERLVKIPGVRNFEALRQVSAKNDFTYGFSMEFDSQQEYDEYNTHPDHISFVQTYWVRDVEQFMEIDYERLS